MDKDIDGSQLIFGFHWINVVSTIVIGIVSLPFLWALTLAFVIIFQPPCLGESVPQEALHKFLGRIFDDASNQNYIWIESVSEQNAITKLITIQHLVSDEFEILYGNDFLEDDYRAIQFENGLKITVYFDQKAWSLPECLSDEITDRALEKNLKMLSIRIDEESFDTE